MIADSTAMINNIRANDPDGGEVEPTESAYDAFRNWVITTYGPGVYAAYINGTLHSSPHNIDGTSDDYYG